MTSHQRHVRGRFRSLNREWVVFMAAAVLLLLLEYQFVSRRTESLRPVSGMDKAQMQPLRDGYSHSLVGQFGKTGLLPFSDLGSQIASKTGEGGNRGNRPRIAHEKNEHHKTGSSLRVDTIADKKDNSSEKKGLTNSINEVQVKSLPEKEELIGGKGHVKDIKDSKERVLNEKVRYTEETDHVEKSDVARNRLSEGQTPLEKQEGQAPADAGKLTSDVFITKELIERVRNLDIGRHDKWIVLDVTSQDCLERFSAPDGWRILVTGASPLVNGCKLPTCVVLRPDPSELSGPPHANNTDGAGSASADRALLWRNLAFLAAASHGAAQIMTAHCPTAAAATLSEAVDVLRVSASGRDEGVMYNQSLLFNPYAHFGAWAASPSSTVTGASRGPLADNSRMGYLREFDTVLVKHGFSDRSEDLVVPGQSGDSATEASGARFDPSTPPIFIGQRTFSAALPTCSLYRREAFWGLVTPCLSARRRCRVIRQYVTQRLLREVDAFSGLYQLHGFKDRSHTKKTPGQLPEDVEVAENVDVDVEKLATSLDAWRCSKSSAGFFACFGELADHLFREGYLLRADHSLMKSWLAAVRTLGFVEPKRVSSVWRGVRKTSEIRVTLGSVKARLESGGLQAERQIRTFLTDTVKMSCSSEDTDWFPASRWKEPVIKDIVLIVVFNTNRFFWNNFPYIETMHRPYFKNIVYCVTDLDELLSAKESRALDHVTMVESLSDEWHLMYECVAAVSQMNIQGVNGYLQIGDDTLLNTWLLSKGFRDSFWLPKGITTMRASSLTHTWGWYWWRKSRGRPAFLHAMADLEQLSGLSSEQILNLDIKGENKAASTFSDMFSQGKKVFPRMRPLLNGPEDWEKPSPKEAADFLDNYYGVNHLAETARHRALDFFYVPQTQAKQFAKFSHFFVTRGVLIELAVPAIESGLVPNTSVQSLRASSLWRKDRDLPYKSFNTSEAFLHPFKLKSDMKNERSRDFYCKVYLKKLWAQLFKQ